MRPETGGAPRPVVELAGPAGAGKTTLALALSALDPTLTVGLHVRRPRMALGVGSALPELVAAWLSAPRGRWTRQDLRSLGYLTAWRSAVGAGAGPVVVDHGPVYRLASLLVDGAPTSETAAFGRLWERLARDWSRLLGVVVWLDAPDDVLLRRITDRPRQHRVRGAVPADAEAFLAGYRAAYRRTLDAVGAGRARVVELDTSVHDPDQLVTAVAAHLADLTRSPA